MRLLAFHAGGEFADASPGDATPNVTASNEYPYFFYVVEHPDGKVMFDCGAHRDLIDHPRGRLGSKAFDCLHLSMKPGDDAVSQIARAGIAPEDIDHVVQSHLHFDHAGGLEFFGHATAYVQERELELAYDPPELHRDFYCEADYGHRESWERLHGDHDLFGDGRILLLATPGHTGGHQSMLVRLPGRTIILVADAAYLPLNMEQRVLPSLVTDPEAMVASWVRLEELRDHHNAELIFTHDPDWRTKTRVAPEAGYE